MIEGGDLTLDSGGSITFEGVKDLDQESHEKSSNSLAWTSAKGKGTTDETLYQSQLIAKGSMIPRKTGRIINLASVHGLVASAEKSAYVAAKHGLVGLTKVTALENATTGVTCNAICPGWVLTPLVQKQVDAKAAALGLSNEEATRLLLGEKEPSMQFTTPEELGELAVFFCSPAANNVRGVAWNMDGGWAAQ